MAAANFCEDLEVEEILFDGVLHSSLEDHHQHLLEDVEDVDMRNGSGRTLLHLAVRTGKLDWVAKLLETGADPGVKDRAGLDVVQVAEVMRSKCPQDRDNNEIFQLVCLVRERESRRRVDVSSPREETSPVAMVSGGESGAGLEGDSLLVQMVAKLGKSLDEFKSSFEDKINALTDTVTDLNHGQASRDVILEALESSVTRMVEDMNARNEGGQTSTSETQTDLNSDVHMSTDQCMEYMMERTNILESSEDKVSFVRKWYGRLLSESPITSCALEYLCVQQRSGFSVSMVLDSYDIGRIKKTFVDHDWRERRGDYINSFADFQEKKIYMAWRMGDLNLEKYSFASFARSLAQMAVFLCFGNGGRPYSIGDEGNKRRMKEMIKEAKDKKERRRGGVGLDWVLSGALSKRTELVQMIYLVSAVPYIIARDGSPEGTSLLKDQLPSLLEFFSDHVMEPLRCP